MRTIRHRFFLSPHSVAVAVVAVAVAVATALLRFTAPPLAYAWVDPSTGRRSPGTVLRAFDPPPKRWLAGHRGVDLALMVGSPVRAAGHGIIAVAGVVIHTPTVSIVHTTGDRTTYQPVVPIVKVGQVVTEGQIIGFLAPATTTWPGLQWGLKRAGVYRNPLSLLQRPNIRLKRVDAPDGTPFSNAQH